MTTAGYSCYVDEKFPPKLPTIKLELDTKIGLTEDQQDWLQNNVIKSRNLKLLFRNEDPMNFRAAATRAGTFYLA